jgi:hypothetical protein
VKTPLRLWQPARLHVSVVSVVFNFGLLFLRNVAGLLKVTASGIANLIPFKKGILLHMNLKIIFSCFI